MIKRFKCSDCGEIIAVNTDEYDNADILFDDDCVTCSECLGKMLLVTRDWRKQ